MDESSDGNRHTCIGGEVTPEHGATARIPTSAKIVVFIQNNAI